METWFLLTLAAGRLWFLWGTQRVFQGPRRLLTKLGDWPGYLVNCQVCMSVWCGAFVWGAWSLEHWSGRAIVWVLAISQGIMMVNWAIDSVNARVAIAQHRVGQGMGLGQGMGQGMGQGGTVRNGERVA